MGTAIEGIYLLVEIRKQTEYKGYLAEPANRSDTEKYVDLFENLS